MNEIKRGTWVEIENQILSPQERAPQVPSDTKKTPLIMWAKGFLITNAKLGDDVEVETLTGRILKGKLVTVAPRFEHNFGYSVEALQTVGSIARKSVKDL